MKLTLTLLIAFLLPFFAHAKPLASKSKAGTEETKISSTDSIYAQKNTPFNTQSPKLSAQAYVLYDYTTRQVLLAQDSHEHVEPASLTKLMTAYVTFSALKQKKLTLSETVVPSIQAIRTKNVESQMFLEHKKPVSIADLLRGLIIVSANDAANVLAENVSASQAAFTDLMNKEAQRLGMNDTHFANPTGLPDPLHYSSAYDLALLTAAVISDFPEHFPIYSQREFEYNHIKHYNRNRLLWTDPFVDGMKTGHTESSGYSLVATASRNNHRLISVVLGTTSDNLRSSESQRLLNYGYQDFELYQFYKKNQAVSNIRLWKGTENTVRVGIREGLNLTLPKGQRELLKATIETQQPLLAPISEGQQVGIFSLTLDGKPYLELPLVALESVALVNIFSRGIDSIRMIFSK